MSMVNDSSLVRASQLTQKTNQFNFRTKRYTENDISGFLKDDSYECYICSASDDFGVHGQIGMYIIRYDSKDTAFLDTFLLSCRILGRDIEYWMLQSVLNYLRKKGFLNLKIEYIKTDRNSLVGDFLSNCKLDDNNQQKNSDKNFMSLNVATKTSLVDVKTMYG